MRVAEKGQELAVPADKLSSGENPGEWEHGSPFNPSQTPNESSDASATRCNRERAGKETENSLSEGKRAGG